MQTIWGDSVGVWGPGEASYISFSFSLTLRNRQLIENKEYGQQKEELIFAAETRVGNRCGELIARL